MTYNLTRLERDRDATMQRIKDDGIIMCFDKGEREKAKRLLYSVFRVLERELLESKLSLLYVYRQSEQSAKFSAYDGMCRIFGDNCKAAAIGLSVELLDGDQDYAAMVLIHEIAHMKYSGDDPRFFEYMDELIAKYNGATGAHVVNDYRENTGGKNETVRNGF